MEKAVIAGHYVFSHPEFADIQLQAKDELKVHNIDLDENLKAEIKKSIMRYLTHFRLVGK